MRYQREYQGTIWTNHALERLEQRGIKQGDAYAAFARPDQSRYSKSQGGWVYTRTWGNQQYEIVAKQNEHKQWIILTVWVRPINGQSTRPTSTQLSLFQRLLHFLYPPRS